MDFIKSINLKIASPEEILSWSHGEVTKPETINYRTQKPEREGLFSEQIFGPVKDYECACGKYKRIRYKGIICDRCGVEVTVSSVRRERMGHIKLAAPVSHIWFLKNIPSRIGLFLDIPLHSLEKVIYYAGYIITKVNEKEKEKVRKDVEEEYRLALKEKKLPIETIEGIYRQTLDEISLLKEKNVLSEIQYRKLAGKYGHLFKAEIGSEPIKRMLEEIDLKKLKDELEESYKKAKSDLEKEKIIRRLNLVKGFIRKKLRPEWMFLTILPVIPPDLRPMVALDGGRYAASELNDLYRRVINRNNRLKKLLELEAPEVIIRNEKRMLQEAVDALIDNSISSQSRPQSMSTTQRRPLRSLSDILRGKKGRFRQNLLGKRVDYSGRSVIVVGPRLKIDECGLPKKMALELFRPFVISKLMEKEIVHNIKSANLLIQQEVPEVWEALEEVIKGRYVLLNRAPTLHRLGIQAFKPNLIEGLAIQIPALVCGGFNADFDGDQMAVHLPLSDEAQKEAKERMASDKNLLKPATGLPVVHLTQDIVLGIYYLTYSLEKKNKDKFFVDESEVLLSLERGEISLQEPIKVRIKNGEIIETTAGRVVFNSILPEDFSFVNSLIRKKELKTITNQLIVNYGMEVAADILDKIKELGFKYATFSGISWGMDDLKVPASKKEIVKHAEEKTNQVKQEYLEGLLSQSEEKSKIDEFWTKANERLKEAVLKESLEPGNSVYYIIDSGSRGSWGQLLQMIGMKGLVQNPRGELIDLPIKHSYKEGFSPLEYFISTHGARKGLTDTALKTSSAGYLTRRLIDVAQEVIVQEEDCGTNKGITVYRSDGQDFGHSFAERIYSRVALKDIKGKKGLIVKKGEIIDLTKAKEIENDESIDKVEIRSPITCQTLYGICSKCYGADLTTNKLVEPGTAVGVIAAQSIGEPGTQLTMRTFHIGGVVGLDITHGLPRVEELFEVRTPKTPAVISEVNGKVKMIVKKEAGNEVVIETKIKGKRKRITYNCPLNMRLIVKEGEEVNAGDPLTEGHLDVRDIFKFKGKEEAWRYLLNEIQRVYVSQGADINNKHLEVIISQMFSKLRIEDAGDSENFVEGDVVSRSQFREENQQLLEKGKKPMKAKQLILGITKSSLYSDSFLSAASFQETHRVLVSAATEGRPDKLRGLKENVIIGRLIPAGTGFRKRENKKESKKEKEK